MSSIRCLAALCCLCLAAACSKPEDVAGSGPLFLQQSSIDFFMEVVEGRDYVAENVTIAIDPERGRTYTLYCPDLGGCVHGDDPGAVHETVDSCEEHFSADCKLFYFQREVVWDGPIFIRIPEFHQSMPWHGTIQATADWEGVGEDIPLTLSYTMGKGRMTAPGGIACDLARRVNADQGGEWSIRCDDGLVASGRYSLADTSGGFSGTGVDSKGRKLSFAGAPVL